ncbi:hypothetical protein LRE75_17900 [Streptomyces sp. 372A]
MLDVGYVVEVTVGAQNFDTADDTQYKNACFSGPPGRTECTPLRPARPKGRRACHTCAGAQTGGPGALSRS